MSDAPRRPALLTLLAVFGSFVGGPIIGVGLARLVAPDSTVAEVLGMVLLPAAFVLGLQVWLGMAIVTAVIQLVRRLRAGQSWRDSARMMPVPSGAFAFVPISTILGLLGGVPVGMLSETHSWIGCVMLYTLAGTFYGVVLWQLARRGYLPFPDSA